MKKILLFIALLCSLSLFSFANNVAISNITVSNGNLSFNLSWENSWNSTNGVSTLYPKNWDAVWVFMKYQQATDKLWKHLKVSSNGADHSVTGAGGVLQVDAVSDSMGVFIRRTNPGAGNISNALVTLKMTGTLPVDTLNFKVFGIEMVYVPQDTFQLGDGTISPSYFTPVTIGATQENSGMSAGTICGACSAIPAAFPLGYNSFYTMKYEISSEQWVNFLNTLTYNQQETRTVSPPNSVAGTNAYSAGISTTVTLIKIATAGINNTLPAVYGCNFDGDANYNEPNDGQTIALGGIGKADLLAYLDWSALRPMSETEYEKTCRGPLPRVQGEYPWGTTNLNAAVNRSQVTNPGLETEALASSVGLVNGRAALLQSTGGMLRCGIFSTASSGREISGAGFYGNMELAGNVHETVVDVETGGTSFTGVLGDGTLDLVTGDANVTGWPNGNGASNTGIGVRGGTFYGYTGASTAWGLTSYRSGSIANTRSFTYGGRGVR